MNVFALRAAELTKDRPELAVAVTPLLTARVAIEQQVADLDRKVMKLARNNAQARQFMTAPGIGPITALCFLATIDDPRRFKRSRSVGAYAGLTTRRYASGEIDWTGRISKCGDKMLRSYLYEAANVLLTRVAKWSALKAWGIRLAKRSGLRKAKVAVARKLAVILHRMWIEGTEFRWSSKETAMQTAYQTIEFPPPTGGIQGPCRDAGVGAIAPGFAMLKSKRALHIDPPASSYAIMRRACPYRGENHEPGKDMFGEFDRRPGIREQPGPFASFRTRATIRPLSVQSGQ
jgi:hypothetical protein